MTGLERFLDKVQPEPNTGCWLWAEGVYVNTLEYGCFWDGERSTGAHRWAYGQWVGPIPEGLCVLHECDVSLCVNPSHLFLGTKADNNADRNKKGRQAKGTTHAKARLTETQVREIRASALPTRELSRRYGVAPPTIRCIVARRTWTYLDDRALTHSTEETSD